MSSSAQPSAGVSALALDTAPVAVSKPSKAAALHRWRALRAPAAKIWILQQEQCPMQMAILHLSVAHWMASGWHLDFRCHHLPSEYKIYGTNMMSPKNLSAKGLGPHQARKHNGEGSLMTRRADMLTCRKRGPDAPSHEGASSGNEQHQGRRCGA